MSFWSLSEKPTGSFRNREESMGQTRVDLRHLLEDLRDAYPGALEETIIVEIVANSLDSGTRQISFYTDPAARTLTVVDNGKGMSRSELTRYHDLATTSKQKGKSIGFAGVGIKLGLLACDVVITETRTTRVHTATTWHLSSRHKAPWKWIDPPGLVEETGTAVSLHPNNPLSPLLDGGFIEHVLREHYHPLFDNALDEILASFYPEGVRFTVNGRTLPRLRETGERVPVSIRLKGKRKPSAVGYLLRSGEPLPESERGVAISTLGKVIKRGWDWLGISPSEGDRIGGLIEVPPMAECLTLNKSNFIRAGIPGAIFLTYRKALQEVVSGQLAVWGTESAEDPQRRRRTRPVERDLENILVELAKVYPLLAALVERRSGGQKKIPLGKPAEGSGMASGSMLESERDRGPDAALSQSEVPDTRDDGTQPEQKDSSTDEAAGTIPPSAALPSRRGRRRPVRYSLNIQFENRPEFPGLGRLVESTVLVNEAHPAYERAEATRSLGYHLALTVAMALAPLAVDDEQVHDFVVEFLAMWGEEAKKPTGQRKGRH